MTSEYHVPLGVFLDFEGTLNDTQAGGRLYARDFVATVGRIHPVDPSVWPKAIIASLADLRSFQDKAASRPWSGYAAHRRGELLTWMRSLYGTAGLSLPADDDGVYRIARELEDSIPVRFAPLPGAVESVRGLAARGLRLYITSGAYSGYVRRCLSDAGVLELFSGVYGPDNLDTLKSGPSFFRRAFEVAGLPPARCLVVDDSDGPVCWARQAGAVAVHIRPPADGAAPRGESCFQSEEGVITVSSLSDVPCVIDGMTPR
jgi:FMN phosphatase YigB (HAD superfamily)